MHRVRAIESLKTIISRILHTPSYIYHNLTLKQPFVSMIRTRSGKGGAKDESRRPTNRGTPIPLEPMTRNTVPLSPASMSSAEQEAASKEHAPIRRPTISNEYTPVTIIEKTDPIWPMYVKEAQCRDKAMLAAWNNSMEVLLVFAGLFSAILTAFLIELHQELKESPAEVTNHLLLAILQRMDYKSDNTTELPTQPYKPDFERDKRNTRVNFLWFTSLTFSLLAASGAMLAKQWIQEYSRDSTTGSLYDQALLRQQRFDGLEKWWFRTVVDLLPTLIHIALILFFCGLVDFLWGVYAPIAKVVLGFFSIGVGCALLVALLAMFYPSCPYRTALVRKFAESVQVVWGVTESSPVQSSLKSVQAVGGWFRIPQDTSSIPVTLTTEKASCRDDRTTSDVISALVWLLRESREEDTVRASLKLLPAVNSLSGQRDQVLKLGAISQLCELFDPSHPFHHRIAMQPREAIAFGLALRSLLPSPQPKSYDTSTAEIAKPLLAEDALQLPLEYMTNHANINLRILAASFAPVTVMNVVDAEHSVTGKEICDMISDASSGHFEVDLWARVLLLDALQEWTIYIYHHAPPNIARRQENTPVYTLTRINRVAETTPDHHITLKLLSALLCSMTVTLGARDMYYTHHPNRISDGLLGERLVKCLGEMQRHKNADGEPRIPGVNHTMLELPDIKQGLIELLRIINKLLPIHPSMFGNYWGQATSQLIDFACGSKSIEVTSDSKIEEVMSMSLQTLLLGEHLGLAKEGDTDHNDRLLRMCIVGSSNPKLPLADDSFLETLKIIKQILCLPRHINNTCGILLEESKSVSTLLVEGLQKDRDDIRLAAIAIMGVTLDSPHASPDVSRHLADVFVEAGLLKILFGLVQQELFGPKPAPDVGPRFGRRLREMLEPIAWLARSSKSVSNLADDSALENLIAIVHHKRAFWEKNHAARAIVMLWDSAIRNTTQPERFRLTQRIIESGFLSTLCTWFKHGDVDDVYKSCQELLDIWAPLLRASFELHPSSFTPPPAYVVGSSALPANPSPFGLVLAMNKHLEGLSRQNKPGQAAIIRLLHGYLDELTADMVTNDESFHLSTLFTSDEWVSS